MKVTFPGTRFESLDEFAETMLDWADLGAIATRHKFGGLAIVFAFLFPLFASVHRVSLMISVLYLVVFAISWDIVSGYSGAFSFGHTFFYAIGGYTAAVMNLQYGFDPLTGIVLGTVLAGIGGLLIGAPTLRLDGPYFALITLIAPLGLFQLFTFFGETFGGSDGIVRSPTTLVGTSSGSYITVEEFSTMVMLDYYIALVFALFVFAIAWMVTRSDMGFVLLAIRTEEDAVKALGIDTAKFKLSIFTLSGLIGGMAGGMFVHSTAGKAIPGAILNLSVMIDIILMVIIGGMATVSGAVFGVLLFEFIYIIVETISSDPYLIVIPGIDKTFDDLMPVPLFIFAMAIVYFMPGGLLRKCIQLGDYCRNRLDARGWWTPIVTAHRRVAARLRGQDDD